MEGICVHLLRKAGLHSDLEGNISGKVTEKTYPRCIRRISGISDLRIGWVIFRGEEHRFLGLYNLKVINNDRS